MGRSDWSKYVDLLGCIDGRSVDSAQLGMLLIHDLIERLDDTSTRGMEMIHAMGLLSSSDGASVASSESARASSESTPTPAERLVCPHCERPMRFRRVKSGGDLKHLKWKCHNPDCSYRAREGKRYVKDDIQPNQGEKT